VRAPFDELNSEGSTPKLVTNSVFLRSCSYLQRSSEQYWEAMANIVDGRGVLDALKEDTMAVVSYGLGLSMGPIPTNITIDNDFTPSDGCFLFALNVEVIPWSSTHFDHFVDGVPHSPDDSGPLLQIILPRRTARRHSATFAVLRGLCLLRPMVIDDSSMAVICIPDEPSRSSSWCGRHRPRR